MNNPSLKKKRLQVDKEFAIFFFAVALITLGATIYCWVEGFTAVGFGNCGSQKIQPGQLCYHYTNFQLTSISTYQDLQRNLPYAQIGFAPLLIFTLTCLVAGSMALLPRKGDDLLVNVAIAGFTNFFFGCVLATIAAAIQGIYFGQDKPIATGLLMIIVGTITFPLSCLFLAVEHRYTERRVAREKALAVKKQGKKRPARKV